MLIRKSLTEQMSFMSFELQEISDVTNVAWKRVPNIRGSKMKWASITGWLKVNPGNFEQFFRRWSKNAWWLINDVSYYRHSTEVTCQSNWLRSIYSRELKIWLNLIPMNRISRSWKWRHWCGCVCMCLWGLCGGVWANINVCVYGWGGWVGWGVLKEYEWIWRRGRREKKLHHYDIVTFGSLVHEKILFHQPDKND